MPFLLWPSLRSTPTPDGTIENVYVIHDSAKVIDTPDGKRLTTASPPFSGVYGFGIFTFLYPEALVNGPVIISGYTYRDMDGVAGYMPGTAANQTKPIKGAVIRSVGADNFIAYSSTTAIMRSYGFSAADVCRTFSTTAIHPQTMYRATANITSCEAPYIVNNLNFKLADKDTQDPGHRRPRHQREHAGRPRSG